jgi:ubiquinone/menaquinone biosynthesis C-methylase UbiE
MMSHITSPDKPPSLQIHHPGFAAVYDWLAHRGPVRHMNDPLRKETAGEAYGLVLEVGAGPGLNFPFYSPGRVERAEAVEPDKAMLAYARRRLATAPVPITLTQATVEALPFSDDMFDSVVVTVVFCSVADPARGFQEIKRVLKPGGTLLMFEHVRADTAMASRIQDALVPLTTRLFGNCHWNRGTGRILTEVGFQITHQRRQGGGLRPIIVVHATRR